MGEIHIKLEPDHMPKDTAELVEYLRAMICVDDHGMRRLPNYVDDQVCDAAADLIEKLLAERAPPETNLVGEPVGEIVAASTPAAELLYGRDVRFYEAMRTLPIGTKLYAKPQSEGQDNG